MNKPQTSSFSFFTPVVHTLLAVMVFMAARLWLMPQWSPVDEPTFGLSFLILWMMSVLPVLYLAFRRWSEKTIDSFFPQVCVFIVLSFGVQTALNAVSIALGVAELPAGPLMPFVWALPWLAMTTRYKNSYTTTKQCWRLLLALVPTVLLVQVLYLVLPAVALLYTGVAGSVVILLSLVAGLYDTYAWRLNKSIKPV